MKVKNPGRIQTNYFKLVLGFIYEFILPYKGAGSTYTTALVQEALQHLFQSANQNFFQGIMFV